METMTQESTILLKTKELCRTILDEPGMQSARAQIDNFMADEKSRAQYEGLMAKGQALQQKQQRSQTLSGEDITAFEKDREALMNNPVARDFLEAQEKLHNVHHSINDYVVKTLELGRVPTEADFDSNGCGDGCGCGHDHHH